MISEKPISTNELCNFFLNGFINGYIGYHDVITNIEDIEDNIEIITATWKLGFQAGISASNGRIN